MHAHPTISMVGRLSGEPPIVGSAGTPPAGAKVVGLAFTSKHRGEE